MQSFFDATSRFTSLTKEGKEALTSVMRIKEAAKGYTLVNVNTVCNEIFFIERGLTRPYYYKDGKDVTDWISMEGTFACSIVSFISRQPDRRGIETLEDCTLYAFYHHDLEQLCAGHHDVEHFWRLIVSFGLIQLQKRFDDLHFATAVERYKKVMDETPSLIQRVPLGILASYLGIAQETLSRIRSQMHLAF